MIGILDLLVWTYNGSNSNEKFESGGNIHFKWENDENDFKPSFITDKEEEPDYFEKYGQNIKNVYGVLYGYNVIDRRLGKYSLTWFLTDKNALIKQFPNLFENSDYLIEEEYIGDLLAVSDTKILFSNDIKEIKKTANSIYNKLSKGELPSPDQIIKSNPKIDFKKYALGGSIMTETVSDKVKKGFSIIEFQEILDEYFPYNFGFKVFKPKKMNFGVAKIEPDYDEAPSALNGYKDGYIGGKLFFPQYKTNHDINFKIHQGGENTYFNFMLLDKEHNIWVGTFGFKDLGDVDANYITSFIAFLMECYGLPFNIKHSVYESGGNIQDTNATVLVISSKNPLAKQIGGAGWSYIYNSHGVNLLEKDNNKYIVFPLSYISQVDKNVIKDDIEYIKNNFGIVDVNWKIKDEEKFAMSDFTYSEGGSINKIERYLIWQNRRNDEYQWSVVIDNERIIGTININKYCSNYDVEPKVNIEDFDAVETSNKAIKLFEENKEDILQFVINQIGRQYVFSQGQKFQNGGQFLKVEVVINSDYDNSKKFSNFKAAKKYVLDNIDKADHEIIDQYGDSIFIEKDSTQEDLDFLFSNIKEEEE